MEKKKTKLQLAQEKAQVAINRTNEKIGELGEYTLRLHDALTTIQEQFDSIRNIPSDKKFEYEQLKEIRLNWKQQAEKIDKEYKKAAVKGTGGAGAGVAAGIGVAALGPTAAMGIATTFGVASTGTAISTLSGAAATNAALAWLGGGALAAGGGGMAAGNAFLAMAGPVGWAIAGVALISSGLFMWKASSEKKRLESIYMAISQRDIMSYEASIVELNERITRIENEAGLLEEAIKEIDKFGLDYSKMSEKQQYVLGSYVNLMSSSTQLLVNPIKGIQPKFGNANLEDYLKNENEKWPEWKRNIVVSLANLLYKIELDDKDKKLLFKSFKKNNKFLESANIPKKEFVDSIMDDVKGALEVTYNSVGL